MLSKNNRRPRSRPRTAVVALVGVLLATVLAGAGSSPASADDKAVGLGGSARFSDGAPAADVKVDLFQAISRWQRGDYIGPAFSGSGGGYEFLVPANACFIAVAIAPLGTSFDFADAGRVYDQRYVCSGSGPTLDVDFVLYREDVKPEPPTTLPPTTQPPATHPPTTQPPPTLPPTTQPPTTLPPTTTPPEPRIPAEHIICALRTDLNEFTLWQNPFSDGYTDGLPDDYFAGFRIIVEGVDVSDSLRSEVEKNIWYAHLEPYNRFYFGTGVRQPYNLPAGRLYVRFEDLSGAKEDRSFSLKCGTFSPIALDIDGSGAVERIDAEVAFDFDADGETETVAEWFAPTEGILFDTRIEGPVSGAHLFGDQGGRYADGFEKLALLDVNDDSEVAGAELEGLALWTDGNSNAQVDSGEVSRLADHAVVALSTSHVNMVSEARLSDGSTMMTEDLWFAGAPQVVGSHPLSLVGLGLMAMVLLGLSVPAAGRRRDQLDEELRDLVAREVDHTA